jgi:hypothetical protein
MAIIDGKGLCAVHLNGIRHHSTLTANAHGYNPLSILGVGKVQDGVLATPRYYLFENKQVFSAATGQYVYEWQRYADYTDPVKKPNWLNDSQPGYVTLLSTNAKTYDYIAGRCRFET